MRTQPRRIFPLFAAAVIALATITAQAGEDFPGSKPDRRILKTQEKVDALFEKGDYERAYFIYREELAPLGDKYAQYMVGYMTLVGKGVASDLMTGSAWYRLAAERGDVAFTQARDEVLRLFSDEQRKSSDQRYFELRRQYSDVTIVAQLVEKDLDVLDSRVDVSSIARDLVGAQYNNKEALAKESAEVVARIENRLSFLEKMLDVPDSLTQEERDRIHRIERRAYDVLQSYKTPD